MGFEYDSNKSSANKSKHGISFSEARFLWDDKNAIILPSTNTQEPRYLVIGMINDRHWAAIVTDRADNIRLISVRRAHDKEIALYEKNKSFDA